MNLHKFLETFLPTTKDESDAEDPTLPSARHPPKTPLPRREPRKLSGTMVLRFDEALKKLGEPAEALN